MLNDADVDDFEDLDIYTLTQTNLTKHTIKLFISRQVKVGQGVTTTMPAWRLKILDANPIHKEKKRR